MSGLILKENLSTLLDASEACEVAESALLNIEIMTIACAINQAANVGQKSVRYTNVISDEALSLLKSKNYRVVQSNGFDKANIIYFDCASSDSSI